MPTVTGIFNCLLRVLARCALERARSVNFVLRIADWRASLRESLFQVRTGAGIRIKNIFKLMLQLLIASALVLFFFGPAAELRAAEGELPELTTAAQVRQLTPEQADRHYPVKLRGVMTLFDQRAPSATFRFIQDSTAGVYLFPGEATNIAQLAAGQDVEVQGVSGKGEFAPIVIMRGFKVLGQGKFPAPKPVSFEELASGREDSQFVEFTGIVRSAQFDQEAQYYVVDIAGTGGRLKAYIQELPVKHPEDLADSTVRVRGVCATHFNQLGQLFDLRIIAPRPEDLVIEKPAPEDPFAIPAKHIEQLLQFSLEGDFGHRVKVAGIVVCRPDDSNLYIEDETEGLHVETKQAGPLLAGDKVEVLGFPSRGDYTPMIQDAVFRKIGGGPLPTADAVTTDEALKGTHDCRLVRIEAVVLDRARHSPEQFLVLQSGGFIFHAYLARKGPGTDFAYLQNGSKVAVTGVCLVEPGNAWRPGADWRAKSFRLLMRSAGDILVLAEPPWWDLRRMLWAVAVLAASVLLACVWVVVLRRRVHQQTKIIRQKLDAEALIKQRYEDLFENANDLVFTQDLAGSLTSINTTGEQLLQRNRREILGKNVLDFVAEEQRGAAGQWLERVVKGQEQPPAEWDFINVAGQRLRLEISTRIVGTGGKQEVEGIGRDITERNRLENEILEISTREQRRIGHDLHDGVCQQLAGIAYRLDILSDEFEKKGLVESAETERIGRLINEAVNQTRGVARGLFPVRLENEGLVSALEELAANAANLFKVNCRFACEESPPEMDQAAAIHLYYIAQEAVVNAAKHAHGAPIQLTLMRMLDRFALVVEDSGPGFRLDAKSQTGMGIRIMRYRARVIGATLDLKSEPGKGTQLICTFYPVPKSALKRN
jgi:PAS domain S-box-containing protein